jgi:hypothetical protein
VLFNTTTSPLKKAHQLKRNILGEPIFNMLSKHMLFKIPNAQFILQNKQIVYLFTITIVFILDLSLISSQLFIFIYY